MTLLLNSKEEGIQIREKNHRREELYSVLRLKRKRKIRNRRYEWRQIVSSYISNRGGKDHADRHPNKEQEMISNEKEKWKKKNAK